LLAIEQFSGFEASLHHMESNFLVYPGRRWKPSTLLSEEKVRSYEGDIKLRYKNNTCECTHMKNNNNK